MERAPELELFARPATGVVLWRPARGAAAAVRERLDGAFVSLSTTHGETWLRSVAANPNADQLSVAARNQFAPLVTFVTGPPDSLPLLAARTTSELYLCQHGSCQLPARSIEQLREQLSVLHEGSRSL